MEKIVYSPAKVNLFLKVTGMRDDGYHELNSVFRKISLYDKLTFCVNQSGVVKLDCDNPELPVGKNNLVVKAALMLKRHVNANLGAGISLEKQIPAGAGHRRQA